MSRIHPTAIIDPTAELDSSVEVGAYSVIGAKVQMDAGCIVHPHVMVSGPTRMGKNNQIYSFASVGAAPQDKKYAGEDTWLIMGDGNVIRESATLNRGTTVIPNPRRSQVLQAEDRLLCFGRMEEMRSMTPSRRRRRAAVRKLPQR